MPEGRIQIRMVAIGVLFACGFNGCAQPAVPNIPVVVVAAPQDRPGESVDDEYSEDGEPPDKPAIASKGRMAPEIEQARREAEQYRRTATTGEVKREARDAYKKGRTAFNQRNYEQALRLFARADALYPGAAPKHRVALCLDKLGRRLHAIAAYQRFIDSKPSQKYTDRIAAAKKRVAELRKGH